MNDFSRLVLSTEIVDPHVVGWSEDDIVGSGRALTESLIETWQRG